MTGSMALLLSVLKRSLIFKLSNLGTGMGPSTNAVETRGPIGLTLIGSLRINVCGCLVMEYWMNSRGEGRVPAISLLYRASTMQLTMIRLLLETNALFY